MNRIRLLRVWPGRSRSPRQRGMNASILEGAACRTASGNRHAARVCRPRFSGQPGRGAPHTALSREADSLAGTADAITAETVEEALRQGDPVATRIWDETTEILGDGRADG